MYKIDNLIVRESTVCNRCLCVVGVTQNGEAMSHTIRKVGLVRGDTRLIGQMRHEIDWPDDARY